MHLVVVIFVLGAIEIGKCAVPTKPVTNEDIRDAILSVVHMIRSTEDKLERHEYRERALGDQIKKALTTIDKRQKLLDPVKGTLSRIDERLAAVETILMQKDERERIQLEKTNELVEQIQQNLPKMFEKLKSDILFAVPKDESKHSLEKTSLKADLENLKKELETKIDNITNNFVKNMEQIREDNKNNTKLFATTSKNLEDVKHHINNTQKDKNDLLQELQKQKINVDQILTNIKTIASKVPKVAEVSDVQAVKNDAIKSIEQNHAKLQKTLENLDAAKTKSDLQPKILQSLEQQKANIEQILSNVKTLSNKVPDKVAQPTDIQAAQKEGLKSLDQIKKDLSHQISQIEGKCEDTRKISEQTNAKLQKSIDSIDAKSKNDVQPKILQALEQQKINMDQMLSNVKTIANKVPDKIAQVTDIQTMAKPFEQIKKELVQQLSAITDSRKSSEQSNAKLQKVIESIDAKLKSDLPSKAIDQQKTNIDQILTNVKTIAKKMPDKIAEGSDVQASKTEMLKSLDQVKQDLELRTSNIESRIFDFNKLLEQNHKILLKTIDTVESKTKEDLQPNILQALERQKVYSDQMLAILKNVPNRIADVADVQDARSETEKSLDQVKNTVVNQVSQLEHKLADMQKKSDENNHELCKVIVDEHKLQKDTQPAIIQALELQKLHSDQIFSNIQSMFNQIPGRIADATDVQDALNKAKVLLEQIKNDVSVRTTLIDDKLNIVEKLSEQGNEKLYNTIMESSANKTGCDLQPQILQVLNLQRTNIDEILKNIHSVDDKVSNVAKSENVDQASSEALKTLTQVGNQCLVNYDSISIQLQELQKTGDQNAANINKTINLVSQKNPDLQPTILQAVELQNKNLEKVLNNIPSTVSLPNTETNNNETLHSLQQIKDEILGQGVLLTNKITALYALSEKNNENLQKTIVESGEMAEQLNSNVASSFEKLSNSVRSLSKLDQIMVQTADAVLDTKRRVEYGVHQISLDVGNVIKKHSKELNSTINARFDNFELTLLQPENGALTNFTSKIASEIDQVWRQIGIMHQQMGENTETLERIQAQTDSYINGSATTMDNVRGKVGQITNRMAEVDDNLNYLLGRLSLVTQEFNRIKTGLGEALDQIKGSFNTVQQKIRETGPGPHQIESNEMQSISPSSSPKPANYQF